jgi:pyruvate,water dikinase
VGGLTRLEELDSPSAAGGKGASLAWLAAHGYRTPPTWIALPGDDSHDVSVLDPEKRYAVRSSANVEDGSVASYAGQFLTVLDVTSHDGIVEAIAAVRDSVASPEVSSYAAHMHEGTEIVMTVLVQEMVTPKVSGVVFTRNPITGLNEVVIEAVAGRGDQLVEDGVTPQRWVRRWGGWTTEPADAILPDEVATLIATEAAEIAAEYGKAADLEWVWDGSQVWWVQIRPITGIDDIALYSNRISKEVMPGLIKPLVWSVNVPVVNRAWIQLFTEAIGSNDLEPDDLAKPFAYRSYFNMGAIGDIFELLGMPRDSLEVLLGLPEGPDKPKFKPSATTFRKTPRLLAFAARKSGYGKDPDKLLGGLRQEYRQYDADLTDRSDGELLKAIDELMEIGTRSAYANIVVPLLANLYGGLLRKRLDKHGVDYATVDIGSSESANLDPNPALDHLAAVVAESGAASPEAQRALGQFLDNFGHFSDSGNDFSVAPWREQPDTVLAMATARGTQAGSKALMPWDEVKDSIGPVGRATLGPIRTRAARYRERRDQVSSLYTYGYGLFRKYFVELGRRLVDRGALAVADDVMFLTLDQLKDLVRGRLDPEEARAEIVAHRTELERVADLAMPETIYGDDFIPVDATDPAATLHGVATSRGHYRGPVKVITGIADFDKLQEGDVLAIPFSDVGWTPLFAKAGAVVAESGGMLSHSSIVAREYGLPCVVSVSGATRLTDGEMVTVDGYQGEVIRG